PILLLFYFVFHRYSDSWCIYSAFFFFTDPATPEIYTLSLHDALPIFDTFASLYLQNNGDGTFTATPLPQLAQISPIRGIVARDVDGDGKLDLIVAGNVMEMEPNTTAPDAGNGLWLKGDGQGHFIPVTPFE